MSYSDHRLSPRQTGVRVSVEMNHICAEGRLQIQQPLSRRVYVRPWIVHPLQLVRSFSNRDALQGGEFGSLFFCETRTKHSHEHVHLACCKAIHKVSCI